MDRIIIYSHNSEILIVANEDNVDLLCEYVGLLIKIPFPKCILAVTLITARIKFMRYQFAGSVLLPKTLCNISHSKNKI